MTTQEIWQTYASSWKAETAEEKRALFERSLQTGCTYTDPLTQLEGWDALLEYMLEFHKQIPGGHFVTTWFLEHHQRSIAKWEMRNGEGTVLGEGISYGTFSEGKLTSMTGFFETN